MNTNTIIREEIVGARNLNTCVTMIVLFFAGLGFFLAGLSSYLDINLLIACLRCEDWLSGYLFIELIILLAADIAFLLGPSGFSFDANLITFFRP